MAAAAADGGVLVLLAGLPGAMARGCAEVALDRGLTLATVGLAGASEVSVTVSGTTEAAASTKVDVQLYPKAKHQQAIDLAKEQAAKVGKELFVIDYTAPTAVRDNVALYAANGVPFVMGTTGFSGTAAELNQMVGDKTWAVIAPNMNKQIVAFQAMVAHAASTFPGAFSGYDLSIRETHQKTKRDTSGTAKAVLKSLADLAGLPADAPTRDPERGIKRVRDEEQAMSEFGVPASALSGHAYHTYRLESPSVAFEFKHNVQGRRSYCEGTMDAVSWLVAKKGAADPSTRVFAMTDVIRG